MSVAMRVPGGGPHLPPQVSGGMKMSARAGVLGVEFIPRKLSVKGGGLGSGWSARYRTDEETLEMMNSHVWE